jgi:TetR/AcrR family transcriptional regulator, ethionamide resistance regulator
MAADPQQTAAPEGHQTRVRQSRQESRQRIVAATTELVRRRAYAELSVDAVMREAGLGRTIFYRHFDDLADLLMRVSREAVEELFQAQSSFVAARPGDATAAVRRALEAAIAVYQRHGPLLRCVAEAAAGDEQIAQGYAAMRARFDDFAERSLRDVANLDRGGPANLAETARALNLMNETYLTDAFGREPRVAPETAVQTLTEIWDAVIHR